MTKLPIFAPGGIVYRIDKEPYIIKINSYMYSRDQITPNAIHAASLPFRWNEKPGKVYQLFGINGAGTGGAFGALGYWWGDYFNEGVAPPNFCNDIVHNPIDWNDGFADDNTRNAFMLANYGSFSRDCQDFNTTEGVYPHPYAYQTRDKVSTYTKTYFNPVSRNFSYSTIQYKAFNRVVMSPTGVNDYPVELPFITPIHFIGYDYENPPSLIACLYIRYYKRQEFRYSRWDTSDYIDGGDYPDEADEVFDPDDLPVPDPTGGEGSKTGDEFILTPILAAISCLPTGVRLPNIFNRRNFS